MTTEQKARARLEDMLQHAIDLQTHVKPLADAIRGYVLALVGEKIGDPVAIETTPEKPMTTTNDSKPLTETEEKELREEYGKPNAHHHVTYRRDICGLLATLDATRDEREKYRGHLQAMLKRAERMPKVRAEATRNGVMLVIHELRRQGQVGDEELAHLQAVVSGQIDTDVAIRQHAICAVCWLTPAECETASPPCPGHQEHQAAKGGH